MQGHYEETSQATPFSNISVNNPNRYTNANRVNRFGAVITSTSTDPPTVIKTEDLGEVKPVLSISISTNGSITTQSLVDTPISSNATSSGAVSGFTIGRDGVVAQQGLTHSTQGGTYLANGSFMPGMQPNSQEIASLFNLPYNHGYN